MNSYTVAERLERLPLTNYQRMLFFIIATAWFFDCIDVGMMTFVLPAIKADFVLNSAQTGMLAGMSFVGMFIGAALSGILADRFGRCVIFRSSMIIWGISSLACALANSVETLALARVVLGIGMSMELPAGQALLCEYIPSKDRGRYIALMEGFWPIGFICAGLIAYFVLPVYGWRGAFIAEALPAIFVLVVRRLVPESPRWLFESGNYDKADQIMSMIENKVKHEIKSDNLPEPKKISVQLANCTNRFSLLELWSQNYRKRTIVTWTLWFFALLGYYALTTWLSALLEDRGYSIAKSNEYIICMSIAGIPGFFTASWLLEKWGRKPTVILMLINSALFAFLYGNAPTFTLLAIFGLCMQFFMFGMWSVLYAYTPELYPTKIRSSGAGFASAIGRVGALIGPVLVGLILPQTGQSGVFMMAAISFMMAAIIVFTLGEETKGKVLEEI